MNTLSNRLWWLLLLRGVLAILFALIAFFMPGITLAVLIIFFGAYAFVDGAFLGAAGIRGARAHQPRWGVLVLQGLVGVAAGLVAWIVPGLTALALIYIIAAWAIFTGILEIVVAIRLRHEIENEWMLGLNGIISFALGVAFVFMPAAGLIAWVWTIGIYALISGVIMIALARRLKGLAHTVLESQKAA